MIEYENRFDELHVWSRSVLGYQPHFHDSIEVALITSGSTSAAADFNEVQLNAGDIFIAFPNQIHSYTDIGNLSAKLIIIPRRLCTPLNELIGSSVPSTSVISSPDTAKRILPLIYELESTQSRNPAFAHEIIEGCIEAILAILLSELTFVERKHKDEPTERRIISYCVEHYTDDLTLELLSKKLYISKYQISSFFSEKMKICFKDFINTLRLDDVCKRIRCGESISAAALNAGFSSIRTFNRVFLAKMGMPPSIFLETHKRRAKNEQNVIMTDI